MSSTLGLLLTVFGLVFKERWNAWQSGAFVGAGIFGLVLSCFLSWRKRYLEAEQERAKNAKPDVHSDVTRAGYRRLISTLAHPPASVDDKYFPDMFIGLELTVAAKRQVPFSIRQIAVHANYGGKNLKIRVATEAKASVRREIIYAQGVSARSEPVDEIFQDFTGLHELIQLGEYRHGWLFFILQCGEVASEIQLEDVTFAVTVFDQFGAEHKIQVPRKVIAKAIEFDEILLEP